MLDLILDMFPANAAGTDVKFLEPACGSGNFLEEIVRRKLEHIRYSKVRAVGAYEHRLLRAVASVYGVDICAENVTETRDRLVALVRSHYYNDGNTLDPADGFVAALRMIVATNIVHADMLTDAGTTEVIDYQPRRGGYFVRVWSMLDDSPAAKSMPTLFDQNPGPKQDEVPVHYLELAANPEPTRARPANDSKRSA
jgi:hypothetical protein